MKTLKSTIKNLRSNWLPAIALCAIIAGCGSDKGSEGQLPVIDVAGAYSNITTVNLSEYASAIDYIPLETTDSSLIHGDIISISIAPTDQGVVIYRPNTSQRPLHISNTGKFITPIGKEGRSKEEFGFIYGIFVHNNSIDIASYDKINTYNINDGSFEKNIPTGIPQSQIHRYPDGTYAYLSTDFKTKEDNIIILDPKGDTIATKLIKKFEIAKPTAKDMERAEKAAKEGMVSLAIARTNPPAIYAGLDSPLLLINEKDTLYTLDKAAQIHPEYLVDYGEFKPGFYWNSFLFETDKFITGRALFNGQAYPNIDKNYRFIYFIYDKQSGTTRGIKYDEDTKSAGFANDLDANGIAFYPKALANGKMYQLVDAIQFMDIAEKSSSQKMKDVAATLTEESNPVLVVATLK